MDATFWTVVLTGGGFGVILALFELIKFGISTWVQRRKQKENSKERFNKLFDGVKDIYNILNIITQETNCSRAMVLKLSNGGNVPSLRGNLYGSILYESFMHPLPSQYYKWQHQLLDQDYLNLMKKVINNDSYLVKTNLLANDSLLKTLYKSQEIIESHVHLLQLDDESIIYLTMNSHEKIKMDDKYKDLIRSCIADLKSILNRDDAFKNIRK